jgi:hypothetical protein
MCILISDTLFVELILALLPRFLTAIFQVYPRQLPLTLTAVPNGLQAAPGQLAPGDYALLVDDKVIAFHVD